jgi:hypothetical protein
MEVLQTTGYFDDKQFNNEPKDYLLLPTPAIIFLFLFFI